MRDAKRIQRFVICLQAAWELIPDWRFGQLISNIFGQMKGEGKDPFFVEDDSMIEYIEKYIEKYTGVALHE